MQIYRVGVPAVHTEYKLQNEIAISQNKANKLQNEIATSQNKANKHPKKCKQTVNFCKYGKALSELDITDMN
jgi:uncharacterized protein YlxW (UPF0749 family)